MPIGDADFGQTRAEYWYSRHAKRDRPIGKFSFRIVTTSPNQSFSLPLGTSHFYTQDFTVKWGDSSSSKVSIYNDPNKTHIFVSPGTYDIVIKGTCECFAFDSSGSGRLLVKQLNYLNQYIGLKVFNLYSCINLDYIDPLFVLGSSLLNLSYCFYNCSSLPTIHSGLFSNCTAVTTLSYCFYNLLLHLITRIGQEITFITKMI